MHLFLASAPIGSDAARNADRLGQLMSATGWVLLVIIAAVVLLLLSLWVKKRFDHRNAPEMAPDVATGGFAVGDLRRMRDSGEISDEEYERARERIVAGARRTLAKEAEAKGDPDRPPPDAPHVKNLDLIRDAES